MKNKSQTQGVQNQDDTQEDTGVMQNEQENINRKGGQSSDNATTDNLGMGNEFEFDDDETI